ncbi:MULTISPECIES: DUF1638 domain-containing protein [unclassified Methanosarcina]|uniref:DUF1638 domain-containing protein n=1 Tax=unclassified Methanosarcina TaxID=2644672 RepID=UPI0006160FCE|nr:MULTISPECIES: DUF1638 domain-containing protein [unclassified Methanosarcina]AKB19493.1 hypothetical protein MSWHS_2630 [Methanosarcina sp. WWM596]AKB22688.1 hypothetical protein MSWH1_2417 [Methanosarcina sp. WH1]
MTVMGIIGCRVFEDEIVHVLSNDPEVERIYLVKDDENIGLLHKLEVQGLKPVFLPVYDIRVCLEQSNEFSVIVQLQEIGLHINPSGLKSKTYTNLNLMSRFADGILLFYGLCGHAFSRVQKDFAHTGCSLQLLQDRSSGVPAQPLADCIAAALGGNSRYRDILKNHSDTFFLTPMWAANWKYAFGVDKKSPGRFEFTPKNLKELGYRKVARVNTGLSYEPDFKEKIEEFALNFGFEVIELKGSTEIAQKSYNLMQNMLLKPLKA